VWIGSRQGACCLTLLRLIVLIVRVFDRAPDIIPDFRIDEKRRRSVTFSIHTYVIDLKNIGATPLAQLRAPQAV